MATIVAGKMLGLPFRLLDLAHLFVYVRTALAFVSTAVWFGVPISSFLHLVVVVSPPRLFGPAI